MKIQTNIKMGGNNMSKRRRWMVTSTFVCPECDTEIPLPREHCTQREKGHIKDLYCPKCKKKQKFKEYNYKQFYKTLDGEVIGA